MKKRISRILALLLLLMPLTAFGEAEVGRDETVYAALDPSGKVRSVEIITHRAPMKDEAVDYGKFTNLTLLDGAKPEEQAGTLVWKKGTLDHDTYYSVTSEKKPPVDIAITYAMDGKEMPASEIAGKTGEFTISLSLGKTDLMTQVSVVLPLERFSDIRTDGMKSVVGKNTRVTVTHLGTEAKTYEITGKTKGFALEPIQISATYAAFDLSGFGEIDKLTDGVDRLTRAAGDLANGATRLSDGASELAGGSVALSSGMTSLVAGHHTLTQGFAPLTEGLTAYTAGVDELVSKLKDFSTTMEEKMKELKKLEELAGALSKVNAGLGEVETNLSKIVQGRKELHQGLVGYRAGLAEYLKKSSGMGLYVFSMTASAMETVLLTVTNNLPAELVGMGYSEDQATAITEKVSALLQAPVGTGLNNISTEITAKDQQMKAAKEQLLKGLDEIIKNDDEMTKGEEKLLAGLREVRGGLSEITAAVSGISIPKFEKEMDLSKLDALTEGGAKLREGLEKLHDGTVKFDDGLLKVSVGMDELSSGAVKLSSGVTEMKDGIASFYASGMIPLRDGIAKAMEPLEDLDGKKKTSFLDEKNSVDSIVYVFVTDAIEEPAVKEETPVREEEKPLTFWERLVNLFR